MLAHDERIREGLEGTLRRLRAFRALVRDDAPTRALWRPLRELEEWLLATAVDLYRETQPSAILARPMRAALAEGLAGAADRAQLIAGNWSADDSLARLHLADRAIEDALRLYEPKEE